MPEAPPVTSALAPLMSMAGILERCRRELSAGSAGGDGHREHGAEPPERSGAGTDLELRGIGLLTSQQSDHGRSAAGHPHVGLPAPVGPDESAVADLQPVL